MATAGRDPGDFGTGALVPLARGSGLFDLVRGTGDLDRLLGADVGVVRTDFSSRPPLGVGDLDLLSRELLVLPGTSDLDRVFSEELGDERTLSRRRVLAAIPLGIRPFPTPPELVWGMPETGLSLRACDRTELVRPGGVFCQRLFCAGGVPLSGDEVGLLPEEVLVFGDDRYGPVGRAKKGAPPLLPFEALVLTLFVGDEGFVEVSEPGFMLGGGLRLA